MFDVSLIIYHLCYLHENHHTTFDSSSTLPFLKCFLIYYFIFTSCPINRYNYAHFTDEKLHLREVQSFAKGEKMTNLVIWMCENWSFYYIQLYKIVSKIFLTFLNGIHLCTWTNSLPSSFTHIAHLVSLILLVTQVPIQVENKVFMGWQ